MSIPECGSVTALCGLCVFVQPVSVKDLACSPFLERVLSLCNYRRTECPRGRRTILHLGC